MIHTAKQSKSKQSLIVALKATSSAEAAEQIRKEKFVGQEARAARPNERKLFVSDLLL